MSPSAQPRWPMWFARIAGGLVLGTGVLVLLAWALDVPALQSLAPGWPKMAPATALSFALLGAALLLGIVPAEANGPGPSRPPAATLRLWAARVCAGVAALIGLLRLAGDAIGVHPGIDALWAGEGRAGTSPPARMSPASALDILLLACALLLATRGRAKRTVQALALLALLIGWLGSSRYFHGGEPLLAHADMALHTGLSFLLLGAGVLCLRTDAGWVALLAGNGPGSAAARRLLPAVLLIPLAIGWLPVQAQRAGWLSAEAAISLFALSSIVLFGAVVWTSSTSLNHTDLRRRLAAEQVQAAQRLLRAIVDHTAAVIYVKDLQGRYLMVNRRYSELFGIGHEAIVGKTDHELFPAAAADAFRAIDRRVIEAQAPLTEEETAPHDDGPHTYVSVKSPLRGADGHVDGVFGISTDITERKLAEARLQSQLERLNLLDQITRAIGERQDLQSIYQVAIRSLEERLPVDLCCICHYDPLDNVLTVTRVGVHSEALAMDLALGEQRSISIDENGLSRCLRGHLVHEPDIATAAFDFPRRLAGGGLRSLVLAPLQSQSRVFGVLVAARREPHAFSSSDCEFLGQLSAHIALAAHQAELHASLQAAYDDLRRNQQAVMQQERLRALGQMASGIAHDINNAISPVALYAESLLEREPNLSPHARSCLETISRAIDDVAATVSRMREFYRQREPQLALTRVSLNPLIRQVVELTRARWNDMPQQRGVVVRLETDLAAGLPEVMGVESEIREALLNLVFNAVDAMPEGGELALRTRAIGGPEQGAVSGPPRVRLDVADTGLGMDEDTRRRCLEPFFTTKGERGTGLGLAMVYGVVQRHAAVIAVDSRLGRGTTVRLSFPVAPAETPGSTAAVPPSPVPARLRILLVDDDPLLLRSLRETLEADGHMVLTASGGQAGIDAVRAAHETGVAFGAVITDLGMPYVDGRRVAGSVKALCPRTPVILLTGWGQRLLDDADIPPHVDAVLNKPPRIGELREALARCCRPAEPAALHGKED